MRSLALELDKKVTAASFERFTCRRRQFGDELWGLFAVLPGNHSCNSNGGAYGAEDGYTG